MADGAAPKTQDHFRNMFHKRPLDDAGLPPPKAEASTASRLAHQPLPPPKEDRAKRPAAGADEDPAEEQLDEDAIEDALFGDSMPEAKEISAEEARRNAQQVTSNKSLVKDHQPLPPGWVQRVSKKKSQGKVYYVNLRTVRPLPHTHRRQCPAKLPACALPRGAATDRTVLLVEKVSARAPGGGSHRRAGGGSSGSWPRRKEAEDEDEGSECVRCSRAPRCRDEKGGEVRKSLDDVRAANRKQHERGQLV